VANLTYCSGNFLEKLRKPPKPLDRWCSGWDLKGISSKYKSRFYHYMGLIRVLLEKLKLFSKSRNSLSFMELEDHCFFLKCLPLIHISVSSDPFHNPTPVCFLKMHFKIILSSAHSSYKWSLSLRFKPYLSCVFYVPCLEFLILIRCGREYASQSYSLCHFLRPPFIKLLMVCCKHKIISILCKMFLSLTTYHHNKSSYSFHGVAT
jgi:hypothetical protein